MRDKVSDVETTDQRVARNVKELREIRGLKVRDLAASMSDWVGQKLLPSGVTKVEQGARRVDVSDLVALALALDATPNRLLLPPEADDTEVQLSPNISATARQAWVWANGLEPLTYETRSHRDRQRKLTFRADNNPLVEPELTAREGGPHWDQLVRLGSALSAFCRRNDLSPGRVVPILQWIAESQLRAPAEGETDG
ncbi:transcriptional regulator with XRE-family HTH domain [Amycolatopsis lexingtonensis]|uniref:Transcriptional regulator with XRE-family HTH domain n=1 Tax=Amycolatopsis lexingtonensis TaxID=218822 RepID=A0ABR9IDT5_9PSEU|nr:hypothetical protein [Amycolatopsis lexingtonensis]MBE1501348.1 transcriptional regulator with XRE-family HTH domain [Amycolatopsis lexingtonensis]